MNPPSLEGEGTFTTIPPGSPGEGSSQRPLYYGSSGEQGNVAEIQGPNPTMTLVANSPGSPETRDYACLGGPILPRLQPIGSRPEFATSVNIYVMSRKVTEHLDHTALASKSPPI